MACYAVCIISSERNYLAETNQILGCLKERVCVREERKKEEEDTEDTQSVKNRLEKSQKATELLSQQLVRD